MHEHPIPESLIEQIRSGKAALVVGAGIGVPSWKQLLERMTKALESRGRGGDDAATDTRDRSAAERWSAPAETPALPKALAKIPFRHVWTTFPGDILEHAFETQSP